MKQTHHQNISLIAALVLTTGFVFPAHSELINLTYSIESSDFRDSNSNPPNSPTSNGVAGTITFTIDDSLGGALQNDIIPLLADGFDITDNNGTLLDYGTGNTAVDFERNRLASGTGRVLFGATVNSNDFLVGLSNDFRIAFDIDSQTYQPIAVIDGFTFNSTVDAFYTAQVNNVSLQAVSPAVIPVPAAVWLMGSGLLALIGVARRRSAN